MDYQIPGLWYPLHLSGIETMQTPSPEASSVIGREAILWTRRTGRGRGWSEVCSYLYFVYITCIRCFICFSKYNLVIE